MVKMNNLIVGKIYRYIKVCKISLFVDIIQQKEILYKKEKFAGI